MYTVKHQTKQFDLNRSSDLRDYDAILNDPLCSISREVKEKLVSKEMDEEGNVTSSQERLILVVTWQRKTLVE